MVLSTTAAGLVIFGSVAIAGGDSGGESTRDTATSGSFEVAAEPSNTSAVTTTASPEDESASAPATPQPESIADPAESDTSGVDFTTMHVALDPLRVRIPGIGVDAPIIDLGLNSDGTLEVPSNFDDAGWYTGRSIPGEVGTSVVVGHVDSTKGPAVFYRLRELDVGDRIQIDRSDGSVAWFEVTDTVVVDKDEFPTDAVYNATDEPTLRLITCGGSFDRDARSYLSNVIVYAEHVGTYEPAPAGGVS